MGQPGNRGFGCRLRGCKSPARGSGPWQVGGEERHRVVLGEGSCGDHLAWPLTACKGLSLPARLPQYFRFYPQGLQP